MASALEDKEAIRELMARYCLFIDTGRNEEWVDCFTPEGVFDSPVLGRWEGRDALLEFTKRYADFTGGAQGRHCTMNAIVELEGEHRARGECYLLLTHAADGETHLVVSGQYPDRFLKVGGRWLFAERRIQPDTAPAT